MHDKTVYALKQTGGIMFFDINEDADGELSAVSMVDTLVDEYNAVGKTQFERQVWVYLNNHPLEFTAADNMGQPFIDANGRTQLPLRKVAQAIGVTVDYEAATRTIALHNDQQSVTLQIDTPEAIIGDTVERLDCAPMIVDNRTYIPARVVFESFGYQVQWNNYGRSVYLQQATPGEQ